MAALVLSAAGCPSASKGETGCGDESEQKVTFVKENFPQRDFDVKEFSSGIQHVGIPTADVEGTVQFYKKLGFEQVFRRLVKGGRDFAFLKLGNLLIEVIPNPEPALKAGAVDHICLDVKNIDEVFRRIKEAGFKLASEQVNEIDFWDNGARFFFILGPNNERIEFCEIK